MDDAYKGQRAKIILDDEVYQEAQTDEIARIFTEWLREPSEKARNLLWLEARALNRHKEALQRIVDQGAKARRKKEELNV